jgi:N-acetylmuramoyl-L-alanine amidase
MYQNLYLEQSLDLSTKIQHEYGTLVKTNDNGVKQAGFLVLWKTAMPSLLTEIGFLTNPNEEKVIGSQKGQDKIAQSIFLAFEQYKAEKEGSTYTPNSYDLSPLVLKTASDSVAVDTTGKNTAPDTVNTTQKTVKLDSIPAKQVTHVQDKTSHKGAAPNDSTALKIKKMQEAINANHSDTSSTKPEPQPSPDSTKQTTVISIDTAKIIYKVQFAVSPHPLSIHDSKYAAIPDIDMYVDNTTYKYTAGHCTTLKEATDLQTKLRSNGYKDAFVVTFKGNKRLVLPKTSTK